MSGVIGPPCRGFLDRDDGRCARCGHPGWAHAPTGSRAERQAAAVALGTLLLVSQGVPRDVARQAVQDDQACLRVVGRVVLPVVRQLVEAAAAMVAAAEDDALSAEVASWGLDL